MKTKKIFLITIDTEGDNQWDLDKEISTENTKYLPRFQELAEKYKLKPTWLTNYEIVSDNFFVEYMKKKQKEGLCEIGMHLHAWNNPPEYNLSKTTKERDYLIEYPEKIMREKIKNITNLLTQKFGIRPVSHRSGRWAMNDIYFKIIEEEGYKVDCSVTPHVDWTKNLGATGIPGSNYYYYSEKPYFINNKILEIPMTIRKNHNIQFNRIKSIKSFLGEIKRFIFGRNQWMRPDKYLSKNGLKGLIKKCSRKNEYIMFMIHSSELMEGGSPSFKTSKDIEKLYRIIEKTFKLAVKKGYIGMTLNEFYDYYAGGYQDE